MQNPIDIFLIEFGFAHFHAQRFEFDLATFLLMLDRRRESFVSLDDLLSKSDSYSKKTLGSLLNALRGRDVHLTAQEEQSLDDGLVARNYLVHRFFAEDSDG